MVRIAQVTHKDCLKLIRTAYEMQIIETSKPLACEDVCELGVIMIIPSSILIAIQLCQPITDMRKLELLLR